MKILHYLLGLPPVREGGLVNYVLDLARGEILLGHEVGLLVPDKIHLNDDNANKIVRKDWNGIPCYRIQNPPPVLIGKGIDDISYLYAEGDQEVYTEYLKDDTPDIIHVHSLMGLHLSFLKAAKDMHIPIVFTTHDYYGLCIKASLLKGDVLCGEADWKNCYTCQQRKTSIRRIALEQSTIYRTAKKNPLYRWLEKSPTSMPLKRGIESIRRSFIRRDTKKQSENTVGTNNIQEMERLRTYYYDMFGYITCYHFNSTKARSVFEQYLGSLSGRVINISNASVADHRARREFEGRLRIGYIGYGTPQKGFFLLNKALDELYQNGIQNFECHIYFDPKQELRPYLKCYAPYSKEKAGFVYRNMDILVLPSVWNETFGMVVLEALSYGVPVIISDRVGAYDILKENLQMGIVVEPNSDSLKTAIYDLIVNRQKLYDMNKAICEWNYNFSFQKHVEDMIEFYREA